jgi:periplasmic protein TonB
MRGLFLCRDSSAEEALVSLPVTPSTPEDTMFDRTLNSSWDERSRRGLMTVISLGLQTLAVAVLLVFPLFRPQGLPLFHQLSTPISWGQPLASPPTPRARVSANTATSDTAADIVFTTPRQVPKGISDKGDNALPQVETAGSSIPGAGTGDPNGVMHLFEGVSRPILPIVRPPTPVAPIRVSTMSEGSLVRKVQPAYPALARTARVQGEVVLQAVISKSGTVENLKVLAGPPMLVKAAIDAVNQWRYRPYILNGEPVEVETQITVNFSLAGN